MKTVVKVLLQVLNLMVLVLTPREAAVMKTEVAVVGECS